MHFNLVVFGGYWPLDNRFMAATMCSPIDKMAIQLTVAWLLVFFFQTVVGYLWKSSLRCWINKFCIWKQHIYIHTDYTHTYIYIYILWSDCLEMESFSCFSHCPSGPSGPSAPDMINALDILGRPVFEPFSHSFELMTQKLICHLAILVISTGYAMFSSWLGRFL